MGAHGPPELERVRVSAEDRRHALEAFEESLRVAARAGLTLQAIADAAGITRARVSQIVGVTGRPRGRRPRGSP